MITTSVNKYDNFDAIRNRLWRIRKNFKLALEKELEP